METGLLIFAIVMACLAVATVVYALVVETTEAWNINRLGWVRGHRQHRL